MPRSVELAAAGTANKPDGPVIYVVYPQGHPELQEFIIGQLPSLSPGQTMERIMSDDGRYRDLLARIRAQDSDQPSSSENVS